MDYFPIFLVLSAAIAVGVAMGGVIRDRFR
jgi:hypothetical protein